MEGRLLPSRGSIGAAAHRTPVTTWRCSRDRLSTVVDGVGRRRHLPRAEERRRVIAQQVVVGEAVEVDPPCVAPLVDAYQQALLLASLHAYPRKHPTDRERVAQLHERVRVVEVVRAGAIAVRGV